MLRENQRPIFRSYLLYPFFPALGSVAGVPLSVPMSAWFSQRGRHAWMFSTQEAEAFQVEVTARQKHKGNRRATTHLVQRKDPLFISGGG